MKKALITAVFGSAAMLACAQSTPPASSADKPAAPVAAAAADTTPKPAAGSADARALEAIHQLNPQIKVDHVGEAPLPGFRELVVGGQTVYVSDDGRYLLQGNLYDIPAKQDLSQNTLAAMRKHLLDNVAQAEFIVFAPANPQYMVTVFTDTECGYCRRMHNQLAEYNKLGIGFRYLAFPRMGPASDDFREMEAVWCSNDRKKALTDAKNGKKIQAVQCTNPVMAHWTLGQRVGLQGTPMVIAANGAVGSGYMPPAQMLEWLKATQK